MFSDKKMKMIEDVKEIFEKEVSSLEAIKIRSSKNKPFLINGSEWRAMLDVAKQQQIDFILIKIELLSERDYEHKGRRKFTSHEIKKYLEGITGYNLTIGTSYNIKSISEQYCNNDKARDISTVDMVKEYNKKISFEWNSIDCLSPWLVFAITRNKSVYDIIDEYVKSKQKPYIYALLWIIFIGLLELTCRK